MDKIRGAALFRGAKGDLMQISMWKRFSYALCLIAALVIAGTYAITVEAGPSVRTVQLRDDCDPATFNFFVGPGTCVGDGDTTFPDFIEEFTAQGSVDKWRFNPDRSEADRGVKTENRGGELHTFTEVAHFGPGFVEALNAGQDPITECAARDQNGVLIRDPQNQLVPSAQAVASFVFPGTSSPATPLSKGTHTFQCCIHPWMHSTIVVR